MTNFNNLCAVRASLTSVCTPITTMLETNLNQLVEPTICASYSFVAGTLSDFDSRTSPVLQRLERVDVYNPIGYQTATGGDSAQSPILTGDFARLQEATVEDPLFSVWNVSERPPALGQSLRVGGLTAEGRAFFDAVSARIPGMSALRRDLGGAAGLDVGMAAYLEETIPGQAALDDLAADWTNGRSALVLAGVYYGEARFDNAIQGVRATTERDPRTSQPMDGIAFGRSQGNVVWMPAGFNALVAGLAAMFDVQNRENVAVVSRMSESDRRAYVTGRDSIYQNNYIRLPRILLRARLAGADTNRLLTIFELWTQDLGITPDGERIEDGGVLRLLRILYAVCVSEEPEVVLSHLSTLDDRLSDTQRREIETSILEVLRLANLRD